MQQRVDNLAVQVLTGSAQGGQQFAASSGDGPTRSRIAQATSAALPRLVRPFRCKIRYGQTTQLRLYPPARRAPASCYRAALLNRALALKC